VAGNQTAPDVAKDSTSLGQHTVIQLHLVLALAASASLAIYCCSRSCFSLLLLLLLLLASGSPCSRRRWQP
jgi:hypothetical protein